MATTELRHFKPGEFRCKCGRCRQGFEQMSPGLLHLLDAGREMTGFPWRVNSGMRCPAHNREVGGVSASSHLDGHAADIGCPEPGRKREVVAALLALGAPRVLVYPEFVHVDNHPRKAAGLWPMA